MRWRFVVVLLSCLVALAPAATAEDTEPQVYFFWSASCPYCKAARTFLISAQAKDTSLRVRDFEVDGSIANLRLLGRLYEKVGMPDLMVVPVVVIGHHVVIGFIDDETTGAEILGDVAECRKTGCTDAVRDLIEEQDRLEATVAWAPLAKVKCQKEPGRAIR